MGSSGAFPILDNLVSRKPPVVELNGVTFGPRRWIFSVYRILVRLYMLYASGNSGVIWCISAFQ